MPAPLGRGWLSGWPRRLWAGSLRSTAAECAALGAWSRVIQGALGLEQGIQGALLQARGWGIFCPRWNLKDVSVPALFAAWVVGVTHSPSPCSGLWVSFASSVSTIFALYNRPLYTIKCPSLCCCVSVPGVGGGAWLGLLSSGQLGTLYPRGIIIRELLPHD